MPWNNPKTDWTESDPPTPAAFRRIEGNILELKKAATIDIADTAGSFTATNVEDALQELAGNVSTGKTAVASAIYTMGQQATGDMTFAQLAAKICDISDDATASVGEVLAGDTFYQGGVKRTGTMPNRGAVTITPGQADQAITAGYHNGSGKVSAVAFDASKVLTGTTIAGKEGTMPNRGSTSFTPGTADQTIPAGYYNGSGKVAGDPDLVAANIRYGKNLFGVAGTFTLDADAVAGDIFEEKTAYVDGVKVTGTALRVITSKAQVPERLYCIDRIGDELLEISPSTLLPIGIEDSPNTSPADVGGVSSRLYHCDDYHDLIYELNPHTLISIHSAASPSTSPTGVGGISDELYLIHFVLDTGPLYEMNLDTLAAIRSVNTNTRYPESVGGIHDRLYTVYRDDVQLYFIRELNPVTLATIQTWDAASTRPRSIGGVYDRLYTASTSNDSIAERNPGTMAILQSRTLYDAYGIGGLKGPFYDLIISTELEGVPNPPSIQYLGATYKKEW